MWERGLIMGIILLVFGFLAIAAGIFGKDFYQAGVFGLVSFGTKSSTWSGRLVFIVVGIIFIAVGIEFVLRPH